VEVTDADKNSSLLQKDLITVVKMLNSADTRANVMKLFTAVSYDLS
jgi:hypothetical protein